MPAVRVFVGSALTIAFGLASRGYTFNVTNEVRQGGVLSPYLFKSPYLFAVYLDELSIQLGSARVGCTVENMVVDHLMFADDICVFSPSISRLQCLLNICGDYAGEHEITFNCNKTIGVLFCSKKYKQPAPSNVFLNGVRVQFFDQVRYLGVWINASLKDDDDIQRQVKSLCCAANKLRGTFDQCSPAVKNTLFRAHYMPIYACQLWSKYTQTSMKRLSAAYNNAYRITHFIHRNVSVRPHQVSHCVRTFDTVLRNNYRFFMRCASSSNFFIRSFLMSDAFYKSSLFLNYSTLLYGRE